MMMDTPPIKKQRSTAPYQTLFLPNDLIPEILSALNVKNILRFKCVSKSWNTLISDPTFVEKHLKKSSQNPHLTLFWRHRKPGINILPFPVHSLLKNPSINVDNVYSHNFHYFKNRCTIVGSCNGLLCLLFMNITSPSPPLWLRFWNPATRTRSKKLDIKPPWASFFHNSRLTFGYDASTRTYKLVSILAEKNEASWKTSVKVFSVGNNCWRNIQSFNTVPVKYFDSDQPDIRLYDGVHLNGTVNWLTQKSIIHPQKYLIVSLDLSTETYKQFQLPSALNGLPFIRLRLPVLRVFMDSFCFSHDSNQTELVLWQMKEFGVQESWTQLFKIRYQSLQMHHNIRYGLACIYVNGDMLILASVFRDRAFIYNLKDRTVEKIDVKRNSIQWIGEAKDYVESLVSVH